MILRPEIESAVRDALARAPAVALLGARQVGKTTLARRLARESKSAIYLDLERPADLRKLDDADDFLRAQSGRLTIIDEVHRAPALFAELRGVIDERRTAGEKVGQFLLLGSASLDLVQRASESLAGRVAYLEMLPITVSEATSARISIDRLWLRGGFPEGLTAATDALSLAWRQDFVRSYLERDVPMFAPRLPAAMIGRLWTMLANAQGAMINAARLAQGLGVSAPMITRYVDLLVDLLLVRRLQPWSGNLNKRLMRAPKIYVRDSGLVHALLEIESREQLLGHPSVGPSWEGFVIEALIHAAGPAATPLFYRTANGAEIDLVLERAGKPVIAIEVKRSTAPKIEPGFRVACDDLRIDNRLVVYSGRDSYPIRDGIVVHSMPSAMSAVREIMTRPAR